MNSDNRDIFSHMLNRKILVVSPCSKSNESLNIALSIHVPIPSKYARAK